MKKVDDPRSRQVVEGTSPDAIVRIISFTEPVVENVDAATGKVTCAATLSLNVPSMILPEPHSLKMVGDDLEKTSFRVTYGRQLTADTGKAIFFLNDLAEIAEMTTIAAMLRLNRKNEPQASQDQVLEDASEDIRSDSDIQAEPAENRAAAAPLLDDSTVDRPAANETID